MNNVRRPQRRDVALRRCVTSVLVTSLLAGSIARPLWAQDIAGVWRRDMEPSDRPQRSPVAIVQGQWSGDTLCHPSQSASSQSGSVWIYSGTEGSNGTIEYALDSSASPIRIEDLGSNVPENIRRELIDKQHLQPRATARLLQDGELEVIWEDDMVTYSPEAVLVQVTRAVAPPQVYTPFVRPFALPMEPLFRPNPGPFAAPIFLSPRDAFSPPWMRSGGGTPARFAVTPAVAMKFFDNLAAGRPAVKPEIGNVGRASWFVTQGEPYVGANRGGTVPLNVRLAAPGRVITFSEGQMQSLYQQHRNALLVRYAENWRNLAGLDVDITDVQEIRRAARLPASGWAPVAPDLPPSGIPRGLPQTINAIPAQIRGGVVSSADQAARFLMWNDLGEIVRAAGPGTQGRVDLTRSLFSRVNNQFLNGEFAIVAQGEAIALEGGVNHVLQSVASSDEAAAVVRPETFRGRALRFAFEHGKAIKGGLFFVGVGIEGYNVAVSDDRPRAAVAGAGGLGLSMAVGGAVLTKAAPLLALGPVGWITFGLLVLAVGAASYWIGSSAAGAGYDYLFAGGTPCKGLLLSR
jgi:hypothetical protein